MHIINFIIFQVLFKKYLQKYIKHMFLFDYIYLVEKLELHMLRMFNDLINILLLTIIKNKIKVLTEEK